MALCYLLCGEVKLLCSPVLLCCVVPLCCGVIMCSGVLCGSLHGFMYKFYGVVWLWCCTEYCCCCELS